MKRTTIFSLLLLGLFFYGHSDSSCPHTKPNGLKSLIILKADDLRFDNSNVISPGWQTFIDYIEDSKIKASIGIIGNSLEQGNDEYFSLIKTIHNKGNIEFWNHGYSHYSNDDSENPVWEFRNTPYNQQYENLLRTQELAKTKIGITLHAFGAPFNQTDENTVKAIEDIEDIKVWLFGNTSSTKLVLKRYCDIEYPTHNPDYKKFLKNYNSGREYLLLQIHPNSWDNERFNQFKQIIEFLIQGNATFITPFEYYQSLNKDNIYK